MDTLCTQDCGATYTNAILAARLACPGTTATAAGATAAGGGASGGDAPVAAPAAAVDTTKKQKQQQEEADKAGTADKPTYPQDYPGCVICVC